MPTEKQITQRIYIAMLADKAREKALERARTNPNTLLLDPQGRVLIDVVLTAEELQQAKEDFGRDVSPVTTVSLDIFAKDPDDADPDLATKVFDPRMRSLRDAYKAQYGLDDRKINDLANVRGSIIALQQEYYFHLSLAARTYTKIDADKFPPEKMAAAHHAAMIKIQPLIKDAFKTALESATDKESGAIDEMILIKGLDKARKQIFKQAHEALFNEMILATGQRITRQDLNKMDVKHKAEGTTATPNDLLHTDGTLGQSTWIAGSDITAHDRMPGKLADRQMMNFADDEKAQGRPRIQIRTPSLDVKKGLEEPEAIADIKAKLENLNTKYRLAEELSAEHPLERKAFIYNLHTAINMFKPHDGSNKQSQGADYILKAAHAYNAAQLDKVAPVFCYVQNLSVNGFGDSLGYDGNALRTEATLMAEMAMLHNLVDKNDPQKEQIKQIFSKYQDYLQSNPRPAYFSESPQGQEAKELIQAVKTQWVKPDIRKVEIPQDMPSQDKTLEEAKVALKAMMAQNLHHGHQYAKLFQALSIYVEEASISGCKSGNERAQSINGRVSIFDSVAVKREPGTDLIVLAINQLAKARPENIERKCDVLKRRLDNKYDKNLQAAATLISNVDQGAGAKLEAKTKDAHIDTNIGEEKGLGHLHQKGAGLMQAHKGLTMGMANNWPNESRSFFDYITGGRMQGYEGASTGGKIGKIFGALVSAVARIVIFPVTCVTYINSENKIKRIEAHIDEQIERYRLRKAAAIPSVIAESHRKYDEAAKDQGVQAAVNNNSLAGFREQDLRESSLVKNNLKDEGSLFVEVEELKVDPSKSIPDSDAPKKPATWVQGGQDLPWKKTGTSTVTAESSAVKKPEEVAKHKADFRRALEEIKSLEKTETAKDKMGAIKGR